MNSALDAARQLCRLSAISTFSILSTSKARLFTALAILALGACCISTPLSAQDAVDSTEGIGMVSEELDSLAEVGGAVLDSIGDAAAVEAVETASDTPEEEPYTGLFYLGRWNALLFVLLFSSAVIIYTKRAKRGEKLFIRKIPGLEAVEEAVGRATEMGRTVLFIPGLQELDEIQTIAGLTILNRVARITAEYETPIMVPVRYPLIYAGAQETVEQAYISVGRKDSYNQDMVRYVAGEQFAYTAHVNGWMVREKPAANIYMGAFFAESLLLAETGFSTGAIQIAGTAEVAQLPFFVTACDYTLIGEELYAASAYLSHEPLLLGGLKGQDLIKLFLIVMIVIGTIGVSGLADSLGDFMTELWEFKNPVGQW